MKPTILSLAAALVCGSLAPSAWSQTPKPATETETKAASTATPESDKAWEDLLKASEPLDRPAEWAQRRPTEEDLMKHRANQAKKVGEASGKAKDFHTRFPSHPKADEAKNMEFELAGAALAMGQTNLVSRLQILVDERLKVEGLSEDEKLGLRAEFVKQMAMSRIPEGSAAMFAEFEKGARALLKEFPKREEPYAMLLEVAMNSDSQKGLALANEIAASPAPEDVKGAAAGLIRKLSRVGKPLNLKFAAVDGRQVDVQKMKGKVVLIDFWATWCGPCVAELPNVKAAYEKLNGKGFEIVGISFDREKSKLDQFVAKEKMAWPQYYDEEGKYGQEFGIEGIPAMWLVDKKGNLRDMNAREDLAGKVEKLLAE